MPTDFRMELSDDAISSIETLFPESEKDSTFRLPRRLQLHDQNGVLQVTLPANAEVCIWDRKRGSHKRTSAGLESKSFTVFVADLYQVTINRDGTADVRFFDNTHERRVIAGRQLIKV